jgi:hypothetical protein
MLLMQLVQFLKTVVSQFPQFLYFFLQIFELRK